MADAFSRIIAFSIRRSLAEESSEDPRAIRNDADFEIDHHELLGRIPVARAGAARKAVAAAVRGLLRVAKPVSRVDSTRWESLDQAKAQARALYGAQLPDEFLDTRERCLEDRELFEMITYRGFANLKPAGDAFSFELAYPKDARYKPGFVKLDCKVLLDRERLLGIETESGTHRPGDDTWELAKMVVRSSQFVYITVVQHSAWLHGLLSARFFLSVYEVLPGDHPLRRLLLPYVHNQHRNIARSRVSVFSQLGGALTIIPVVPADGERWLADAMKGFQPLVPSELPVKWTPGYVAAERIWNAMRDHVGRYVQQYRLSTGDDATARWTRYLAQNAHPRFGTLPLEDQISYVMFAPSVLHHLWGHIYNGNADPAYVSSGVQTPREPGGPLLARGECKAHSAVRAGVLTSIARPVPRLTGDFSHLALDPSGAQILRDLSQSMKDTASWLDVYCAERGLPNLGSPARIATSISI
jgi:hypothetical protein